MAKVADMAGISVSKLKTFNAGVKGSTLGASGPQYVMVPKKHADQLRESLVQAKLLLYSRRWLPTIRRLTAVFTPYALATRFQVSFTSRRKHQRFAAVEQTARI